MERNRLLPQGPAIPVSPLTECEISSHITFRTAPPQAQPLSVIYIDDRLKRARLPLDNDMREPINVGGGRLVTIRAGRGEETKATTS